MKKRLKISFLFFAALCVFAACDSSGGGDDNSGQFQNNAKAGEMTETTAKQIFDYMPVSDGVRIDKFKADGAAALEEYLTSGNAAPAPGMFRAPDADGNANLTLVLNKIEGKFIVAIANNAFQGTAKLADIGVQAVKLPEKLTSIGADSFTDSGITKLQIPAAVKAAIEKTNPALLAQLAQNARAVVIEDLLVGVPIGSSVIGGKLVFEGVQVYEEDNGYTPYSGRGMDVYVKNFGASAVGKITDGKLSAELGEPPSSSLQPFSDYLAASNEEKLESLDDSFLFVSDLKFSDNSTKFFYAKRFYFYGEDEEIWRGVVNKKQITIKETFSDGTVMYADDNLTVRYIYVDNDVVFSGKGKTTTEDDGETNITSDFSINLTKGWNVFYELGSGEYSFPDSSETKPENIKFTWNLLPGNPELKWVLEKND